MNNKAPSKTEPTRQMPKAPPNEASRGTNEGEGNRTADRQYRENVSRHVRSGKSEEAADDARRAVEGDEADDLREAERQGKAGDTRPRIEGEEEGGERRVQGEREDQRAREDQGNRH